MFFLRTLFEESKITPSGEVLHSMDFCYFPSQIVQMGREEHVNPEPGFICHCALLVVTDQNLCFCQVSLPPLHHVEPWNAFFLSPNLALMVKRNDRYVVLVVLGGSSTQVGLLQRRRMRWGNRKGNDKEAQTSEIEWATVMVVVMVIVVISDVVEEVI